jgi:hypothetical protein
MAQQPLEAAGIGIGIAGGEHVHPSAPHQLQTGIESLVDPPGGASSPAETPTGTLGLEGVVVDHLPTSGGTGPIHHQHLDRIVRG